MTPEEVREGLRCRVEGELPPVIAELAAADPAAAEAIFASISASYFRLRRGMAVVALALPILLWLGSGGVLEASLSAYYHGTPVAEGYGAGVMRNVFVGVLWALGVFLYFYKGYSWQENIALDVAGGAAVLVALFPMDWPPDGVRTVTGTAHYTAAVLFFAAIAYVCIRRSGDTLKLLRDETAQARFRRIYAGLGTAMIAAPLGVIAVHLISNAPEHNPTVFFVEVAGIVVFAAFWLVKSYELALIERQPPLSPPASTSASGRRS